MPMSQSASSSPTPRSTSRVMMTGLICPDLPTRGLLIWSIARRLPQDLSYGILPKNLAYPTDGRLRTVPQLSPATDDSLASSGSNLTGFANFDLSHTVGLLI